MDAVIRFCFGINPHKEIDWDKKNAIDEYLKLYGQAEYCWDYIGLVEAKRAIDQMTKL